MNRFEFEFNVYPPGQDEPLREISLQVSEAAAKARAGRLAKKYDGPCDVAHAGPGSWADRYMTTANPSPYHSAGYSFSRLT